MNIGLLNDLVASSSKFGNLALESGDEVDAKYMSAPETNLVKRVAFGEAYTTSASRLQSRIWLSHVRIIPSLLYINPELFKFRSKLNSEMEVPVSNLRLHTGNCNASLTDCSSLSMLFQI